MADAFKASGHRTGMFGKWHLGSNYPFRHIDRGFDQWLGFGFWSFEFVQDFGLRASDIFPRLDAQGTCQ